MLPDLLRARRRTLVCLIFSYAAIQVAGIGHAERQILFDFEQPGLGKDFSGIRQITVTRKPAPPVDAEQAKNGPAGHAAHISTPGSGGFFAKSGRVPVDWRRFDSVSLWVYRSPEEAKRRPATVAEFQIYERDGKARFWRRFDLTHTGWQHVSAPMRWFRYSNGRIAQWDRIDRFGIWFRDAADVVVDTIAVEVSTEPHPAILSLDDLRQVAFPETKADAVRKVETNQMRFLTSAAKLDLDQLSDHLARVSDRVRRDLSLGPPPEPPTLLVFANRDNYRLFPGRLAKQMNSQAAAPRSAGFTTHGIATSFWDDRFGTLRPVYTHEFVHAIISQTVRIPNRGDWFQEGIASYYQIQFHPQANLAEIVKKGLADEDLRMPLPVLLSGRPIPQDRYWQAMTVIELLQHDRMYSAKLPALIAACQSRGSTDLARQLEAVLSSDWPEFTRRWLEHCQSSYK